MQLVIVESPTKAKKLRQILGSGYEIEASVGHVRDLPKKKMGVLVDQDFIPEYEISADKTKVIRLLKDKVAKAHSVILATDPDREGEAIAWHLQQVLQTKSGKNTKQIEFARSSFHEITQQAVLAAINNPSVINMALVEAQQARRVVDRLVGYEVSPVLWRKVRRGLSAGRVQSVALRLIVDREREIEAFKPEEYWEVDVTLSTEGNSQSRELFVTRLVSLNEKKYLPVSEKDVLSPRDWLPVATYKVLSVEKKERTVASLPPFTTSTLQQAAANRLGMTSKQTMRFAQQLYEEGLITYHRTDSVNLAAQAVEQARAYINTTYGKAYVPDKPRYFANRSKNAQEAHEAIRVTDVGLADAMSVGGQITDRHQKLYDLIRRRFLASQMSAAVFDQAVVMVQAKSGNQVAELKANGSVLKFAGWKELFPVQEDVTLPSLEADQVLTYEDMQTLQKFTQPPARYNDASLVKELEKQGIGRPSTYASIISVIIDRGYVERTEKRFYPTSVGISVCDFLLANFKTFMEYDFTAEMEEDLDRISRGEKEWVSVVRSFYGPFHQAVEKASTDAERVKIPVESTGEKCPECGEGEVVIRTGKYGKFKSCSRFPECKYTKNIVETVAGVVCPLCQKGEVIARKSRWGKLFYGCATYPTCTWASWQAPKPGETLTQAEWDERQAKRAERKANRAGGAEKTEEAAKSAKKKKKTVAKRMPTKKKPVKPKRKAS
ncbi:MAG TPA: type I DNA topoisomerase [Candidatus Woesebacteria bacterium]|nr:type I DNA topoisomerase [Candidatus Woesebacteria bacterium]HNS65289.1 type I DNA topoisomerase [Candidatus Woesebacteria bacterium]